VADRIAVVLVFGLQKKREESCLSSKWYENIGYCIEDSITEPAIHPLIILGIRKGKKPGGGVVVRMSRTSIQLSIGLLASLLNLTSSGRSVM
jgi:hypothetical protein